MMMSDQLEAAFDVDHATAGSGCLSRVRVGLLRVITVDANDERDVQGNWITRHFGSLSVVTRCIQGFPQGVHTPELVARAIPALLDAAERLVDTVDVLAVSCTEDPAVEELRTALPVPVWGAGSSLGCVCRALGRSVGILTIGDRPPVPVAAALQGTAYGWVQVSGVKRTTDIPGASNRILSAARELADRGFQVIALGCTGFSSAGVRSWLQPMLSLPVVDPLIALGAMIVSTSTLGGSAGEVIKAAP